MNTRILFILAVSLVACGDVDDRTGPNFPPPAVEVDLDGPTPAGCVQDGCPDGYECDRFQGDAPSSCLLLSWCDEGPVEGAECPTRWYCTNDSIGGICVGVGR